MKSHIALSVNWKQRTGTRVAVHLLAGYVLTVAVLAAVTADPWSEVAIGSGYGALRAGFWVVMQLMVLLVYLVTRMLEQKCRSRLPAWQRYALQVLFGICGVGVVISFCTLLLWRSLGTDVLLITYPQSIWLVKLTALVVTNAGSMFLASSGSFLKSGASPQRAYLDTLLLKDGSETVAWPVEELAYVYSEKETKERWAQPLDPEQPKLGGAPTITSLAGQLDPELFFHAGRGLVVHWRGVGKVVRVRRRRKIWLYPPHMERTESGEEEVIYFIPRAHVKVFDQWYERCRKRAGADRKGGQG